MKCIYNLLFVSYALLFQGFSLRYPGIQHKYKFLLFRHWECFTCSLLSALCAFIWIKLLPLGKMTSLVELLLPFIKVKMSSRGVGKGIRFTLGLYSVQTVLRCSLIPWDIWLLFSFLLPLGSSREFELCSQFVRAAVTVGWSENPC